MVVSVRRNVDAPLIHQGLYEAVEASTEVQRLKYHEEDQGETVEEQFKGSLGILNADYMSIRSDVNEACILFYFICKLVYTNG